MAWHLGYPLSQTLLTSVYIEYILTPTPSTLADADFIREESKRTPLTGILRAYCLGLIMFSNKVNDQIMGEHFYDVRPPDCDVRG